MFMFALFCSLVWVVCHYRKVLSRVWRLILEPFNKDTKGNHLRWRLGMRLNHVRLQLDQHHSTWAFIILSGRLFICNTIGHRWSKWEHVKYGNFGQARMCKICLMQHSRDEQEKERYYETHDKRSGWVQVDSPDAVFNRRYIQRGPTRN